MPPNTVKLSHFQITVSDRFVIRRTRQFALGVLLLPSRKTGIAMYRIIVCLFMIAAAGLSGYAANASELAVLARPGPWPVADRLIAYQGRIWFSASVKGVNHNSADIWSFDPAVAELNFERYLFSQDAGKPVMHQGFLYWPHEDMRIGLATGVVSVTNGRDWRDLHMPIDDTMMHTHAVTEWQGQLVAALAGWNGALLASSDAGISWQVLANDPPRTGSFHRYNDVTALDGRLLIRHWELDGLSLAEYRDGQVVDVEGWPQKRDFSEFTRFNNALYAIVDREDGSGELWRIGSGPPEPVTTAPGTLDLRALASDGRSLWLVSRTGKGGQVWSSPDGKTFAPGAAFSGGIPHSAATLSAGEIYVGGSGQDGRAIIWGPSRTSTVKPDSQRIPLPEQAGSSNRPFDLQAERDRLLEALRTLENYDRHGRGLLDTIRSILSANPPDGFFTSMLEAPVPDEEIEMFGGQFSVPAGDIATWQLYAAIGLNGEKTVPLTLLQNRWTHQPNGPQKWMDPLLIGLHAIQRTGQNDRATLDALVQRLDEAGDPDWLRSQVTGTLVAITGQRFAYDIAAWKSWWRSAKETWPRLFPD